MSCLGVCTSSLGYHFQYSIEIIVGIALLVDSLIHYFFQYSIEIIIINLVGVALLADALIFQYSFEIICWVGFCFGF